MIRPIKMFAGSAPDAVPVCNASCDCSTENCRLMLMANPGLKTNRFNVCEIKLISPVRRQPRQQQPQQQQRPPQPQQRVQQPLQQQWQPRRRKANQVPLFFHISFTSYSPTLTSCERSMVVS